MSPINDENKFVNIPLQDMNTRHTNSTKEQEDGNNQEGVSTCWNCRKWDLFAKKSRKKVHGMYYDLGCFIQKHYCMVLFPSLAIIIIPLLIGTKFIEIETDVEKLWIATGGRLQQEMEYTKERVGSNGFGIEEFDYESFIQVAGGNKTDVLDRDILLEHLDMLRKIINMKFNMYMQEWSLTDICVKYEVPYFGATQEEAKIIDSLRPCLIMTPLDCFWEGAYTTGVNDGSNSYLRESPRTLLNRTTQNSAINIESVEEFLKRAGVDTGYLNKTCLKPLDSDCPSREWNLKKLPNVSIGDVLTGGCYRVARNVMHWPEDIIISGIERRDGSAAIKTATVFQTIIQVTHPRQFMMSLDSEKRRSIPQFSEETAKAIIDAWKLKFTEMVNKEAQRKGLRSKMFAFSTASFRDVMKTFSRIRIKTAAIGVSVILVYALLSLKRWTSSVYSYGMMGILGVVFVCISVGSGLGCSQFFGMKLSAASTQVLPYLTLGLGLDNMFLLIRTYIYICDSGEFKDTKIIGMCLGECGLSITITAFTNACAFLMASMIPILSLQEFSRQAAIVVLLNWFMLMFIFTSMLSFDVERQKKGRVDLCCCIREFFKILVCMSFALQLYYVPVGTSWLNDAGSTLLQLNDVVTTLKQRCVTMICPLGDDEEDVRSDLHNHRQVEKNMNRMFPGQSTSCSTSRDIPRNPCNRQAQLKNQNPSSGSNRQLNVDQSTVSDSGKPSGWMLKLNKISYANFVKNYFGKWMTSSQVKIIVLFSCCVQLFLAGYGSTLIKQELNVADMLPKGSAQHTFIKMRNEHFSYYAFHMITQYEQDGKAFDYANNQQMLYDFYKKISQIKNVIKSKNPDGQPRFWLSIYRDWLIECEKEFRKEWNNGNLNQKCVPNCNTTRRAKVAHRLLATKIGNDAVVEEKLQERLVKNGIINPRCFYYGLSLWYWNDALGIVKAQASMNPVPNEPVMKYKGSLDAHYEAELRFISIPFQAHQLKTTDDFVQFIKNVRDVCDEFSEKGLPSYPMGIPFTYWEQFMLLRKYMALSGLVVLSFTCVFTMITIMSVRAAFIVVFFLTIISFELYGFIGLLGISFSAIPLVVLIMSVGVGVEFTIHTVLAFVNTSGDRNKRMRAALEITFAPKIDSAFSMLIIMALLSNSELDFIVKFFHLVIILVLTALYNGIFVLPVVLSFFGPCCEVTHSAIVPSLQPAFTIPISLEVKIKHRVPMSKRSYQPKLSTVDEERSSELSSSQSTIHSVRPSTPFYSSPTDSNYLPGSFSNNRNDYISPEWEHVPKLYKNDGSHCRRNRENYSHGRGNYNNFRVIPTNSSGSSRSSCNRSSTSHSSNSTSSNSSLPSSRQSNRYSARNTNGRPRITRVQSQDENRSTTTTTIKAKIEIAVETSSLNSSIYGSFHDDDDDDGLPTVHV